MSKVLRFGEFYGNKSESQVDEGNAFSLALKKAREEGLEEFSFKGKKYKVKKVNEGVDLKVGDKFKHPVYKDLKGKVLLGPDTYEKVEKAGYEMPEKSEFKPTELTQKVWYGVVLADGKTKTGIHANEILKEEETTEDEEPLDEARKVQVKRKYTENRPAIEVPKYAPIREKVLAFIGEKGSVTEAELKEFIKGMNEDDGSKTSIKWVRRNDKYIREYEKSGTKKFKLTEVGKRFLKKMAVNEDLNLYEFEDTETDEQLNESVLLVAGGVILSIVGLKALKFIWNSILGKIGMSVKVDKDKLKETSDTIISKALEAKPNNAKALIEAKRVIDEMIEKGTITTFKQLLDAIKISSSNVEHA